MKGILTVLVAFILILSIFNFDTNVDFSWKEYIYEIASQLEEPPQMPDIQEEYENFPNINDYDDALTFLSDWFTVLGKYVVFLGEWLWYLVEWLWYILTTCGIFVKGLVV